MMDPLSRLDSGGPRLVTTQYRPGERWGDTIPLSAVAAAAAAVESERRLRESRLN
jgi:hypothetical protein